MSTEELKITCPSCGATNEDGCLFCYSCGASLAKDQPIAEEKEEENALFCPTCGRKNTTGGMFCFTCGTKLGDAPIKQETPVVTQPTYSQPQTVVQVEPVAPTPVYTQPQTAVKPVTTTVVAQSGDKPKSKLATAFAVLGLIFAAVLLLTITTIVLMYNMKYGFKEIQPAQLAEFETYAALCKHRAKIIALLSLIPMAFSLTGLIVSIVKNKKGFNCKVSLVLSIVGLAIAVVAIGNCLLNLYMFGRYEIRYY